MLFFIICKIPYADKLAYINIFIIDHTSVVLLLCIVEYIFISPLHLACFIFLHYILYSFFIFSINDLHLGCLVRTQQPSGEGRWSCHASDICCVSVIFLFYNYIYTIISANYLSKYTNLRIIKNNKEIYIFAFSVESEGGSRGLSSNKIHHINCTIFT